MVHSVHAVECSRTQLPGTQSRCPNTAGNKFNVILNIHPQLVAVVGSGDLVQLHSANSQFIQYLSSVDWSVSSLNTTVFYLVAIRCSQLPECPVQLTCGSFDTVKKNEG